MGWLLLKVSVQSCTHKSFKLLEYLCSVGFTLSLKFYRLYQNLSLTADPGRSLPVSDFQEKEMLRIAIDHRYYGQLVKLGPT